MLGAGLWPPGPLEPHHLELLLLANTGIQLSLEILLLLQLCLHCGWVLLTLIQSHQVLLPQPCSYLTQGKNQALLSLTSGEPLRKVYPHNLLSPSKGNLIGILQKFPKLLQLLQLASPGPRLLCECLCPARRVSWTPWVHPMDHQNWRVSPPPSVSCMCTCVVQPFVSHITMTWI